MFNNLQSLKNQLFSFNYLYQQLTILTMWLNNILETIGNTPLIKLNKITNDLPCTVLAKVEYFNPGNSIKDRMALKMVEVAEAEGKLKPGGTIIEGTSGNTGMGLALAACVKGYKCIFVTTDKQSKEKADILKAVGAEVIVCPTNVLPEDPRSYYSVAKRLGQEIPNSMYMNQYDNLANRQAHYESTGPEIWEQTEGKITHLICTAGTGGTITGTAMYLKEKNPNIKRRVMSNISESIKLLGLAIKTLPFEFDGEVATATISSNVDLEQLESIREQLQKNFDEMDKDTTDDYVLRELSDDIYFISSVIDALNNKLDGNNLQ